VRVGIESRERQTGRGEKKKEKRKREVRERGKEVERGKTNESMIKRSEI